MSDFSLPQSLKPPPGPMTFGPPENPPVKAFKPLPAKTPPVVAVTSAPTLTKVVTASPALTKVETKKPFNGLPLDSCTARPAIGATTTPDPDEPLAGQIAVGDPHEPGPRLIKGTRRTKAEAEGTIAPPVDPELLDLKGNWPFQDVSKRMQMGSIVKLRPEFAALPLSDGNKTYQYAIVVSMDPFVVASRDGAARWVSTVAPTDFLVCGVASPKIYDVASTRRYK